MNNVMDTSQYNCTGCSICATSCNVQNAIDMKLNEYGHYEPVIDNEKCISCGKCKISCYKFFKSNKQQSIYNYSSFASHNYNDDIRKNTSSGGVAYEIAKYGLENGYDIYGVQYNIENGRAEHIKLEGIDQINKISGSKYIPSWNVDSFKSINKNDKAIIFASPCQCYGLRKIFKNSNIILVDFFCHGVPSQKLWKSHVDLIKTKEKIGQIKKVNFRDKTEGWHEFSLKIDGTDGTYRRNLRKDKFLRLFLGDYCLGEACYDCNLRFNEVYSDIRLGDFWGQRFKDEEKGTSIVLANEVGTEILKKLNNLHTVVVDFDDVIKSQYKQEIQKPVKRNSFMKDLQNDKSISYLYRKYELKRDIKQKVKGVIKKIIRR